MKRQPFLIFLAFFAFVQLLYYPLNNCGFVTDFTGLLDRFEGSTAVDMLNSFGFPALQPVLNFFLYSFYQLFGTWGLPWYLVFSFMFALDGFLLYCLVRELGKQFGIKNGFIIGVATSILFLVSPYQVELLFWKVLFNFLSVIAYILAGLTLTVKYSKQLESKYLWGIHGFYLLGLFTFELALMMPLFILLYGIVLYLEFNDKVQFRGIITRLLVPQIVAIGAWVLLTKIVVGQYIGHYGAATHLQFDIFLVVGNFIKYLTKHFFFLRYFGHEVAQVYPYMNSVVVVLVFLAMLFGSIAVAIKQWKQMDAFWKLALLNFLWAGIALLPVLNLYFQTLLLVENDRYGSLGWAFLSFFFVLLLFRLLPKWAFFVFFGCYVVTNLYFNQKTVNYIAASAQVHDSLLANYTYEDHSEVYLLGYAENYHGVYMFRDFSNTNHAFYDPVKYVKGSDVKGQIFDVAQFNMTKPTDRLKAAVDSTGRIQLTVSQWGGWWWRGGMGASNYETDKLKVEFDKLMVYITPKSPAEDAVFLYQVGGKWAELEYPTTQFGTVRPGPG